MLVVLGEDALSVMEEDINQGGEGGGDGATYREEAPVVWWTTCRDLHAGADWICYGGGGRRTAGSSTPRAAEGG